MLETLGALGSSVWSGLGSMTGGQTALLSGGLSGGASLLGGLIGGQYADSSAGSAYAANRLNQFEQFGYNRHLMREANAFNALEAQKQRDFISSAYQRTKADLTAAGYNPMLAVSNGANTSQGTAASSSGASVGLQSTPVSQKGSLISSGFINAVNSALSTLRLQKDLELADAQRENIEASTHNLESQTAERDNLIHVKVDEKRFPGYIGEVARAVRSAVEDFVTGASNSAKSAFDFFKRISDDVDWSKSGYEASRKRKH